MTSIDPPTRPATLDEAAALAAVAAGSVDGVHALGTQLARASDSVRERVGLSSAAPGVKIDTGRDDSATATVSLVVDYPHKLHEVSDAVRDAVRAVLEPLALGRLDVNVVVTGVFGPFDRDVVQEAEERADAVAARAAATVDDVRARSKDAAARASAVVDGVVARSRDVAAGASATVDGVVARSKDVAASAAGTVDVAVSRTRDVAAGAAAAIDETVRAARERVAAADSKADIDAADRVTEGLEPATATPADERGDVRDVVAGALEHAAVDIAIAADEVRTADETPARESVRSLSGDDRPRP